MNLSRRDLLKYGGGASVVVGSALLLSNLPMSGHDHDIAFTGARVIDPESGLDASRTVGVTGDKITYVGEEAIRAKKTVDVAGHVLCPGFIDLHSHAQSVNGLRFQALDGVTTAMDLESGALPVALEYAVAAEEGRPINYGYSASWAVARLHVLDGLPMAQRSTSGGITSALDVFLANTANPRFNAVASQPEVDKIVGLLEQGLAEGAIGIGIVLGYAPGTDRGEYFQMAQLASRHHMSVFTHNRFGADGVHEVVGAAADTGASMHVCHINSTAGRKIDDLATTVENARKLGNRVTTEAYPYGKWSTAIGAASIAPEKFESLAQLKDWGLIYLATGEQIVDFDRLRSIRAADPGGIVVGTTLNEDDPNDLAKLHRALTLPDTAIASDSVPVVINGKRDHSTQWPTDPRALAHPRSAGSYARVLGLKTREQRIFTLPEAIRRCTYVPARILEQTAPAMKSKGRVQVGADADITIFDPATVTDRATYQRMETSTGIRHVLVNGKFVVKDTELLLGALPGRPVKGGMLSS
ncbi:amidohydrolase family protein [Nocardia xishanensis]